MKQNYWTAAAAARREKKIEKEQQKKNFCKTYCLHEFTMFRVYFSMNVFFSVLFVSCLSLRSVCVASKQEFFTLNRFVGASSMSANEHSRYVIQRILCIRNHHYQFFFSPAFSFSCLLFCRYLLFDVLFCRFLM